MDSKSTEYKAPYDELSSHGGTKRRRKMSEASCQEAAKRSRPSEAHALDVEAEKEEDLVEQVSSTIEPPEEVIIQFCNTVIYGHQQFKSNFKKSFLTILRVIDK